VAGCGHGNEIKKESGGGGAGAAGRIEEADKDTAERVMGLPVPASFGREGFGLAAASADEDCTG